MQFAAIGKKAELPMGSCFSRISAATFGRCFLNSWEAALRGAVCAAISLGSALV